MAESPAIVITVDDRSYTVRMSDLTAVDAKDFRAAVGRSLASALALADEMDLDVIAGLVWLVRRRQERKLTYTQVAMAMTYDSDFDASILEEAGEPEDADPET